MKIKVKVELTPNGQGKNDIKKELSKTIEIDLEKEE
jgi:hypothetical protein